MIILVHSLGLILVLIFGEKMQKMKVIIVFLLGLISNYQLFAQNLLSKDRFSFETSIIIYDKAKNDINSQELKIKNKYMNAARTGVHYKISGNKIFTFSSALFLDLLPVDKFILSIENEETNSFATEQLNDNSYDFRLGTSAYLDIFLFERLFFNIGGELVLRSSYVGIDGNYFFEKDNKVTLRNYSLDDKGRTRMIWPSLNFGLGKSFIFKNRDAQFKIIYRKTFFDFFKGNYLFEGLENPVEKVKSNYSLSGDFISFSFKINFFKNNKNEN